MYGFAAKREGKGTKGRSSSSGVKGIGYFRTSFQPPYGKGMLRTVNIRLTISLNKKKERKKLLPNLQFVPIGDSELHTQMTLQEVQGIWLFSYLTWYTSREISYS